MSRILGDYDIESDPLVRPRHHSANPDRSPVPDHQVPRVDPDPNRVDRTWKYPSWVHGSLRKKYSAEVVCGAIYVSRGGDPMTFYQTYGTDLSSVVECLSYLKLIHGDDLSGK